MRGHEPKELQYWADILGPDGSTVLASGVGAGVQDLSGRRLEQAQLISAETTHMVLMWAADAALLTSACFVQVDGVLFIVDYTLDPRIPRPHMWVEVYCHVDGSAIPVMADATAMLLENGDTLGLEDGSGLITLEG